MNILKNISNIITKIIAKIIKRKHIILFFTNTITKYKTDGCSLRETLDALKFKYDYPIKEKCTEVILNSYNIKLYPLKVSFLIKNRESIESVLTAVVKYLNGTNTCCVDISRHVYWKVVNYLIAENQGCTSLPIEQIQFEPFEENDEAYSYHLPKFGTFSEWHDLVIGISHIVGCSEAKNFFLSFVALDKAKDKLFRELKNNKEIKIICGQCDDYCHPNDYCVDYSSETKTCPYMT